PHALGDLVEIGDMCERAAAELGHFRSQEKIGRAADGNCVEPGTAKVLPHGGKNLLFVAEVTVGEQNNMAQIAGSLRLAHQVKQGRKHLGPTAGFEALNKMPSTGDVLGVGGKRLRGKLKIAVIEREDGEAVVLMQAVEALQQRASGLLDRSARHGAGNVDHVKHLNGDALCRLN